MAETVLASAREERQPRPQSADKTGRRRRAAAVVTDLQKVGGNDPSGVEQRLLGGRSGVAGQENTSSVPFENCHDRLVVDRVRLAPRSAGVQQSQPAAAPRNDTTPRKDLDRDLRRAG